MRALIASALLLISTAAAAGLPGDIAPPGAPDGRLDVADVLVGLRMSVGVMEADPAADVAPTQALGERAVVQGDGLLNVSDVLTLLRAAVGLTELTGTVDVEDPLPFALGASFGMDALLDVLGLSFAGGLPASGGLDAPESIPCPEGGSMMPTLTDDEQSVEFIDCDTGEFVVNGTASLVGSAEADFEAELDLTVEHDVDGTATLTGTLSRTSGVEFEPGRTGTHTVGEVSIETDFPEPASFLFEIDLIEPDDGGDPIGTIAVDSSEGPAMLLEFDGSSTAVLTVMEDSETSVYLIDLETGEVTEVP